MVHVDADLVGRNLDLDVVRQDREDLDARKGGLAALLGIRGRDANEAMNALLRPKHAIGVLAAHRERRSVDADDLGRLAHR